MRNLRSRCLWALALLALPLPACTATGGRALETRIALSVGSSRIITGFGIRQVAVSDPAVVDAQPVSTSELLVLGLAPGSSQVFIWDMTGRRQCEVTVTLTKASSEYFAELIQKRIGRPEVTAVAVGDKVILQGEVASQEQGRTAEALAKAIYPKVESLLVVNPARWPATLAAINAAISQWNATASLQPDGTVVITAAVDGPSALDAIKKTLEPWSKDVRFAYEVKTAKTAQQEAVEAVGQAMSKWNVKAAALPDGRVLVEGTVPDEKALAGAQAIISGWPRTVEFVPRLSVADSTTAKQVLIRARVVELDRTDLKDLGVDWSRILFTQGSGGDATYSAQDQPFIIGQGGAGPFPLFGGPPILRLDPIGARINALIRDQKAHVLSQPSLVTTSGTSANILVGGEIPVPVPQSGAGAAAVITIEYKQFGISLEVLPTVGENNEIAVHVKPEVSVLDYANAIIISGIAVPALRTRRAESTVHVQSGTSIIIGGLLATENIRNVKAIPLLSKIPILGNFFKSVSAQKKDSELLIIITPDLVTQPTPEQVLPREGADVPASGCGPPAPRCSPESGIGAEVPRAECPGKSP